MQRDKYESTISEIESKYSDIDNLKRKANEFRFFSRELKNSTPNSTPSSDLRAEASRLKSFYNDYQRYTYSQKRLKKLNQDHVNSTPPPDQESPTCIVVVDEHQQLDKDSTNEQCNVSHGDLSLLRTN